MRNCRGVLNPQLKCSYYWNTFQQSYSCITITSCIQFHAISWNVLDERSFFKFSVRAIWIQSGLTCSAISLILIDSNDPYKWFGTGNVTRIYGRLFYGNKNVTKKLFTRFEYIPIFWIVSIRNWENINNNPIMQKFKNHEFFSVRRQLVVITINPLQVHTSFNISESVLFVTATVIPRWPIQILQDCFRQCTTDKFWTNSVIKFMFDSHWKWTDGFTSTHLSSSINWDCGFLRMDGRWRRQRWVF